MGTGRGPKEGLRRRQCTRTSAEQKSIDFGTFLGKENMQVIGFCLETSRSGRRFGISIKTDVKPILEYCLEVTQGTPEGSRGGGAFMCENDYDRNLIICRGAKWVQPTKI